MLERLRIVSRAPIVTLMRTASASVLAFVTVASTIPLAVFSAGGSSAHVSCLMACCAGRGASGGCATGACFVIAYVGKAEGRREVWLVRAKTL